MRVTESCPCGANLDVEAPEGWTMLAALLTEFRKEHAACRTAVIELAAELADRDL